jgi:hypothetical protein
VKTIDEVERWIQGAAAECGDPSIPVCQLFARYVNGDHRPAGEELFDLFCFRNAIREPDEFTLWLGPDLVLPLFISRDGPQIANGELQSFGAEEVTRGVWTLRPSLNIPGLIHGFVMLYDVPSPAPWERLIILPGEAA